MSIEQNKDIVSPWRWILSANFMEGLPGIMIMTVSVIMYKNLGISNTKITLYTGMLTLPWVIKPIWASLIDVFKTKRWWIYSTEIVLAGAFALIAFSLRTPYFFQLSLTLCWITAFISATHDIATDGMYVVELKDHQQSFFIGIQSAAYSAGQIFGKGILVMISGYIFAKVGDYQLTWSIIMIIAAVVCLMVGFYDKLMLPKHESMPTKTFKDSMKELSGVYLSFIKIDGLIYAIFFLMFYRFGEILLTNIIPLFLLDSRVNGGLGLNNQFTGLAYGTVAPVLTIFAGLLGGFAIYRYGMKKMIWIMVMLVNIPNVLYIFLSVYQPRSEMIVLSCISFEQFCYAFGITACNMFMMYKVYKSEYKTAHYAFFTGLVLLTTMIPKMISGWMQTILGYTDFFIVVLLFIIPTVAVVIFLKIDDNFGRKKSS